MVRAEIVPATALHIEAIAKNVREPDRDELWAVALSSPEYAMRTGILYSDKPMTGLIDGEPVCMWGVTTTSLYGNVGAPWMVCTKAMDKHAILFLRRCGEQLKECFSGFKLLENFVDARNVRAIKWLKWMGFCVDREAKPCGSLGKPFHKFSMRGDALCVGR